MLLDPSAAAATLKLWLSTEVTGTLAANGAAQTFTTTRVGQNARYTFAGTTGKPLSLVLSGDTFLGTTSVYVYQPNGSLLTQTSISAGNSATLVDLTPPVTGTYTVLVTPEGTATGTLTTTLWADVSGTLTINGAATAASVPIGRDGRYTFTGTAGQGLGLGITDVVTTPADNYVYVKVLKPDQTVLLDCNVIYHSVGGGRCNPLLLPASGVYTVLLEPSAAAATLKLWLSTEVTGTLAANGAAQTFTTTRVGQNARYTFAGTTGKPLSLVLSGGTFPGTTSVYVYQPNGSLLTQTSLYYESGAGSFTILSLDPPATGIYKVLMTPEGTATGTLTTTLLADVAGTVTLNGAATVVSVPPGHDGRYTFTGTVGKVLSLSITDPVTVPPDGYIS